jgi:hypothetical protein
MGGAICERTSETKRRMDSMRLTRLALVASCGASNGSRGGKRGKPTPGARPYGMMPMSIMGGSLQRVDISYPILSFSILSSRARRSSIGGSGFAPFKPLHEETSFQLFLKPRTYKRVKIQPDFRGDETSHLLGNRAVSWKQVSMEFPKGKENSEISKITQIISIFVPLYLIPALQYITRNYDRNSKVWIFEIYEFRFSQSLQLTGRL